MPRIALAAVLCGCLLEPIAARAEAAPTRLEEVARIALAHNPELLELEERAREVASLASGAGRLPDLEAKSELWGVPIDRPLTLFAADTIMLGLRQAFPAHGSREAARRGAESEARVALDRLRQKQIGVRAEVARAYYEYFLADRELAIHVEHVKLTERIIELMRVGFRAGLSTQADVLSMELELHRLHASIPSVAAQRRSSAARLEQLMGEAGGTLGAPMAPPAEEIRADLPALVRLAEASRAEISQARHEGERARARVDVVRAESRWPTLMVSADYWLMPGLAQPHAYGAMATISLPWLNPRHREELTAAEHGRAAEERALESARNTVRYEVESSFAESSAALQTYRIVKDDLLPAAERSCDATLAGFSAGRITALAVLGALQSLLMVRLDEARALVELGLRRAELERAVGGGLADE